MGICPGPNCTDPDIAYAYILEAMKHEITHIEQVGLHPNVIRIFGTAEDCRVLAMERAAVDLYTLVKSKPRLPLAMAHNWTRGVLRAVAHIHDMGVVHQVASVNNAVSS
jgi:serine/threonine protein kinase